MEYSHWMLLATLAALPLIGCSNATSEQPKPTPHATVEAGIIKVALSDVPGGKAAGETKAAPGADIRRVTLSETAAKRLGIEFAEVKGTPERLEAPYNALLYDATGGEWVFVSPAPNVFSRAPVKVEVIEGEKVFYTQGPTAGTQLVTMGAAELYGIEFGVGK